jgi:hypothetical protein
MWGSGRSRNEGEIFYVSPENKLMAVNLKLQGDFVQPSRPLELFGLDGTNPSYQVSSDGKRFLVNSPVKEASQPLTVVINWAALLNSRAGSP